MPPKTASPRRAAGRSSSPTRGRFARSRTPLRLQLIGLLRTEGPLTATQAGQRLDSRGAERAQARAARAHRPLPRPSAEPGAAAADRRPLNACPLWLRRVPTHPRGRAAPGTPTTHNTPRDPSPNSPTASRWWCFTAAKRAHMAAVGMDEAAAGGAARIVPKSVSADSTTRSSAAAVARTTSSERHADRSRRRAPRRGRARTAPLVSQGERQMSTRSFTPSGEAGTPARARPSPRSASLR